MKTKNFLIIGVISTVTILAFISLFFMFAELNLEQIIKNKDCQALQKWENEHIYDDTLEISSELMTKMFKMEMECGAKALENVFGK